MIVNISGTFAKDKRPDNGLDSISEKLNDNRLTTVMVVGLIRFHAHHEVLGRPETLSVKFEAIEPLSGKDDSTARKLLDKARQARGLGQVELTLFDGAGDEPGEARDPEAGPWPGDADYRAASE